MALDIKTLTLVMGLLLVLHVAALLILHVANRRTTGPGWWALGSLLVAVGSFVVLLRSVPDLRLAATVANNLLYLGGLVVLHVGTLRFLGRRERPWLLGAFLVAVAVYYSVFTFGFDLTAPRWVLFSLTVAFFSLTMVHGFLTRAEPGLRVSSRFLGVVFLGTGVVYLLRAAVPLFVSVENDVFVPSWIVASSYVVILVSTTLWTLGYIIVVTQRLNAQVSALLQEKELTLAEVHHRIKNNMQTVFWMLKLQAERLLEGGGREPLLDASDRVQRLQVLYRSLYETQHFQNLSTKEFLPALIEQILAPSQVTGSPKPVLAIEDFELPATVLQPLGMIVNELLTNSLKFGRRQGETLQLRVTAKRRESTIELTVADNGPGLPPGFDPGSSSGFGLRMVGLMASQLRGTFAVESRNGTIATVRFPRP